MSSGANLKEGYYSQRPLSEDEMWSAFSYLFSSKAKHSASYKYGFLKAILDNLYNTDENLVLTFDQLFSKFTEIYWNLVLKYKIRQAPIIAGGKTTKLEQDLWVAKAKCPVAEDVPFESISEDVKQFVCRRVKVDCKENVVGALYGDMQELLYSFSKKGEYIQFNPIMYEFVCKHKVAIEKLNYYEWAKYLEKINSDDVMDHLLTKIDESSRRTNLEYYRNILFEEFENKCFYCGKSVTKNAVHVDHFIPWSFIKDDNLWNFVLACPQCNESKKDKLAPRTELDLLVRRNEQILIESHNVEQMRNYRAERLINIYSWASDNGYREIWIPPQRKVHNG